MSPTVIKRYNRYIDSLYFNAKQFNGHRNRILSSKIKRKIEIIEKLVLDFIY
jgi:hypothetical protein